ncbi:MAG: type II toxin-antitoxin system VapB family antitoxin [Propionibacteriaceae bacterium]|jgi:hypothetical protein|nr:type II toxin-antitoxin system VapB family antitoxin [Propionibacteriaceae bacterium]
MAINIKNERTVAAVKQLAAHYGVSYTQAIELAAEAALRRPQPDAQAAAFEQVERIAAGYRAHLGDHRLDADVLYGEDGLYR